MMYRYKEELQNVLNSGTHYIINEKVCTPYETLYTNEKEIGVAEVNAPSDDFELQVFRLSQVEILEMNTVDSI